MRVVRVQVDGKRHASATLNLHVLLKRRHDDGAVSGSVGKPFLTICMRGGGEAERLRIRTTKQLAPSKQFMTVASSTEGALSLVRLLACVSTVKVSSA